MTWKRSADGKYRNDDPKLADWYIVKRAWPMPVFPWKGYRDGVDMILASGKTLAECQAAADSEIARQRARNSIAHQSGMDLT